MKHKKNRSHFLLRCWVALGCLWACVGQCEIRDTPPIRFQHLLTGDQLTAGNINAITSIIQDAKGFMWFGGEGGLARFNGEHLEIFQSDPARPNALSGNYIWDLALDQDGVLWVATAQGLNRYNPDEHHFSHFNTHNAGPGVLEQHGLGSNLLFSLAVAPDNSLYVASARGLYRLTPQRDRFEWLPEFRNLYVRKVFVDPTGALWVGTSDRGLFYRDANGGDFRSWSHDPQDPNSLPHDYVRAIAGDAQGRLWVGTLGGGVARLDESRQTFTRYRQDPADESSIGSDSIWDLHLDRNGDFWVATDPGGLARYDLASDRFRRHRHDPYVASSLASDKVRTIYDDHMGDLWVGLFPSGVDYFDRSTALFTNYVSVPHDPNSLSHGGVLRFLPGRDGRLWIGTEGGLNAFDPAHPSFRRYVADPRNPRGLRANAVLSLAADPSGDIWVGTWAGGLHRLNPDSGNFSHLGAETGLGDAHIWSLLVDSGNRLWVGTENAGLNLYDRDSGRFRRFEPDPNDPESLSFRHVWTLLEDAQGRLWVGTIDGLDLLLDLSPERARFRHFRHDPQDPLTLSSNRIIALHQDSRGQLWVGTQDGGLNYLDPESGKVQRISSGLPSAHVSSIVEDNQGFIWVSTVNGLARVDPQTLAVRSFGESNGLVDNNFNRDASYRDSRGHLYFGSTQGFSVFDPEYFTTPLAAPAVVITQLRLFNQPMYAGSPGSPLSRAISATRQLTLSHDQTMFAFDFHAISYRGAHRNQYAYRLEGFDRDWIAVGTGHTATYTNMDPGKYVFRVRAANSDGVWNMEGAELNLVITPPLNRTWWAYCFYALLAALALAVAVRYQRHRIALQNEQALNQKLLKLDRLKDAFLANTSHELRTPLNGIIGLSEAVQEGAMGEINATVRQSLQMISSSGRRLSGLINDILDHAKLNEHRLELHPVPVGLHHLVDTVLGLLRPLVTQKMLVLQNMVPAEAGVMADASRLQQVLLNLVGNAIKFSKQGQVRVCAERDGSLWRILVEDTGSGIAPEDLPKLFSAFTQLDATDTREQGGTGLGLAIARQLVELHGGTLGVESQLGQGSTFFFGLRAAELPVNLEAIDLEGRLALSTPRPAALNALRDSDAEEEDAAVVLHPVVREGGYTLLIVDDDPVNRLVLTSILKAQQHLQTQCYRVLEADNGSDALQLLQENPQLDLVILDVMMPKMSGYETCMRMRVSHPVHRLPVLFLTAKNFSDDLVRGFVAGGNDFLTKPVVRHELLSRVSMHLSLLEINRGLERKYQEACEQNFHNGRELRTLEHIVELINRETRPAQLLRGTLEAVRGLIEADRMVYWRAHPERSAFVLLDNDVGQLPEPRFARVGDILDQLDRRYRAGRTIWILEEQSDPEFHLVRDTFPASRSSLVLTLFFENAVVGFITVLSQNPGQFNQTTIEILRRMQAHVTSVAVKANLLQNAGGDDVELSL
jgi:two-component system sensor histidine kinase ChiS